MRTIRLILLGLLLGVALPTVAQKHSKTKSKSPVSVAASATRPGEYWENQLIYEEKVRRNFMVTVQMSLRGIPLLFLLAGR